MLRRKMLAILLPTVAAATLVGSGFSAWYFGETVDTSHKFGVGVEITDVVGEIGTISKSANSVEPTKIVLDQGQGTATHANDPDYGISFRDAETSSFGEGSFIGATFEFNTGVYNKLTSAGLSVYFIQTVTVNNALLEFVTFQDNVEGTLGNKDDLSSDATTTYTLETKIVDPNSTSMTINVGTTNYINAFLQYGGNQGKPENSTELSNMRDALTAVKGDLITFSRTAVVK